ncbi:MAG TPA: DUF2231 domain-containing protein [Xanthobacteraceae bacterium]|jgi:uncharacterized membrane protein|nr:DUF2231 domain-containing protein [Xanthobacteraceae bacterium]
MHLIPASWSHFHILVTVFPSIGLVFVLGAYMTGMITGNEGLKRICLGLFVLLGLLVLPVFFSGEYSMAQLMAAKSPRMSESMLDLHYGWGIAALVILGLMGLAALVALLRTSGGRLTDNMLHLTLGCAILTLAFMVLVGELGWEINHHELRIPDSKTSQIWSHVHVILNHFPTVGFVLTLAFYLYALVANNEMMKRMGLVLFVACCILGIPTYVTGTASMWALTNPPISGISKAVINAHRDMALWSLFGLGFTGVTAWIELWFYRFRGKFSDKTLYVILGLAIVTMGLMAETGHRGGQINHPEIILPTDVLRTNAADGISAYVELAINNLQWFVPWQTVHFFGYSMVFGVALIICLRALGFWKAVPFSAIYRIMPLGVLGVTMNVFTGMLILLADAERYLNNTTFIPKIMFITIGALAVLYFSVAEKVWLVKAGEDAPMSAKYVAVLVLVSWSIVIMGGRLLPYV